MQQMEENGFITFQLSNRWPNAEEAEEVEEEVQATDSDNLGVGWLGCLGYSCHSR